MNDQSDFELGISAEESSFVPRAILDISEAVNNTKNIDELYAKVHQIISDYIPADNFYIALYNTETKEITYPYFTDHVDKYSSLDSAINDVTSYAISQTSPLLITSNMLQELIDNGKISDQNVSFNEWLGVPLCTADGKTIGLLAMQRRDKKPSFSESHRSFLKFVSTQVATAIQFKQAEESLRNSEEKFRTLYRQNPLMLFMIDENGTVIDVNDRVKVDLEYEKEELIGNNVEMVFHPNDKEKVDEHLKECLTKHGDTLKWELRKISKSGKIVWVRESASALNLPGEEVNVLISCENITEQKLTQLNLKESEEKYRLLTENIDEMILMHDRNGKIIYINEAGSKLTRQEPNELVNSNAFLIFSDEYNERVPEYLQDEAKKESMLLLETELINKNGLRIPIEVNVTKLKKRNSSENILVVARDVRERKLSEDNIRKYNNELKKSNYEKDKFFSIIAHDLRSPFNALLSFSDILLDEFDELKREEIKEYVTHIHSISNNIYELLNNLLDWSKIQTDKFYFNPLLFDLEDTVTKSMGLFQDVASSNNIKMFFECEDRCYAFADVNMISTVLRNLLSNAIKFSHNGSSVKIIAANESDNVKVSIEDTGMGMLQEDIAKLFRIDINYTTLGARQEKGTGLGLILAKEMIEQNGGKIFVESRLGEGSKFSFTLPKRMK